MGSRIGRPVKIDEATLQAARGKYTHICVEVNFSKPLLSKFHLHRRVRRIEYGGMHLVYFVCSYCGHRMDNCPAKEVLDMKALLLWIWVTDHCLIHQSYIKNILLVQVILVRVVG